MQNRRRGAELTCPDCTAYVLIPFVYIPLQTKVPPNSPVERLVRLLDLLCAAIAARKPGGVLPTPLFLLLWKRVRHTAVRAIKVAARIVAGTPPRAPRPPPAVPRPSRPQPLRLPRGFAWLTQAVPGTAVYGIHLEHLLAQPEMARLAADPRMRRLLNPLRQMLGVPARTMRPLRRPAPAVPPPRPKRDSGKTPAGWHPKPPPAPVAA